VCTGLAVSCPSTCTTNAQCAAGQACSGTTCLPDSDGDGTANADDCAPADPLKWTLRPCFLDADLDTYFSTTSTSVCSGAACPTGTQGTAGTDCNDADAAKYQLITCYGGPDADGDTFHAGPGVATCAGAACPAGTSSLQDCDDANANAKPGQMAYFDVPRSDGGFDYDCNGVATKSPAWDCLTSYAAVSGCVAPSSAPTGSRGYVGTSPACGVAGTWRGCVAWPDAVCGLYPFQYGSCGTGCFPTNLSYSVADVSVKMVCK
jgi:hypothetical protein